LYEKKKKKKKEREREREREGENKTGVTECIIEGGEAKEKIITMKKTYQLLLPGLSYFSFKVYLLLI
jgi:hypothetical protein